MSFLDSLGKVAGQAIKGLENKAEQINRYKKEYDRCSDEQLFYEMKHNAGDRRIACMMLLKERGYGNQ